MKSRKETNTLTKIDFLILILEVINVSVIIGSQMAPSIKTSKISVIKGFPSNKISVLKQQIFLF